MKNISETLHKLAGLCEDVYTAIYYRNFIQLCLDISQGKNNWRFTKSGITNSKGLTFLLDEEPNEKTVLAIANEMLKYFAAQVANAHLSDDPKQSIVIAKTKITTLTEIMQDYFINN